MKLSHSLQLLAVTAVMFQAQAGTSFDFKDPKGVNNAVFKLDAPLESINGTAVGISGKVDFDPANPAGLTGKIVVESKSLHVDNSQMKEHLQGGQWLDVAKYPEITFEVTKLSNVKTVGTETTADVTGNFTLHGVTREITTPAKISYLKDKLKARFPVMEGDLLVIRSSFKLKRSDYGINKGQFEDKVSDDIDVSLSVAGMAPKK